MGKLGFLSIYGNKNALLEVRIMSRLLKMLGTGLGTGLMFARSLLPGVFYNAEGFKKLAVYNTEQEYVELLLKAYAKPEQVRAVLKNENNVNNVNGGEPLLYFITSPPKHPDLDRYKSTSLKMKRFGENPAKFDTYMDASINVYLSLKDAFSSQEFIRKIAERGKEEVFVVGIHARDKKLFEILTSPTRAAFINREYRF